MFPFNRCDRFASATNDPPPVAITWRERRQTSAIAAMSTILSSGLVGVSTQISVVSGRKHGKAP
jgi:hypothetical protein